MISASSFDNHVDLAPTPLHEHPVLEAVNDPLGRSAITAVGFPVVGPRVM
jgi:hypothetical protein